MGRQFERFMTEAYDKYQESKEGSKRQGIDVEAMKAAVESTKMKPSERIAFWNKLESNSIIKDNKIYQKDSGVQYVKPNEVNLIKESPDVSAKNNSMFMSGGGKPVIEVIGKSDAKLIKDRSKLA